MDYRSQGLSDTVDRLEETGIKYFGVGKDISSVQKDISFEVGTGVLLTLCACVENEFTVAGKNEAGANPFDPLVSFDDVRELKKEYGGFLVVVYHGGKEYYWFPSPNLQRVCRIFVESGADNERLDIQYHVIVKDGSSVKLANQDERERVLYRFYERTQEIKTEGFIE